MQGLGNIKHFSTSGLGLNDLTKFSLVFIFGKKNK
jgi:hypothetical protein